MKLKNDNSNQIISESGDTIRLQTIIPSGIKFDRDKGIIYGLSIITEGMTRDGRYEIDRVMTDSNLSFMQANEPIGTLAYFKHESMFKDFEQIGTKIGRLRNVRRDGIKIRADFHASKGSDKLPALGNVREWLFDEVSDPDDPPSFGLSSAFIIDRDAVALHAMENPDKPPVLRIKKLSSVDFVGDPAANDGLFSNKTKIDNHLEDEEMKAREYLISLGMKKDATEAEMEAFILTLKADKLAEVKRLTALVSEPEKKEDDKEDGKEEWKPLTDEEVKADKARLAAVKEEGAKDEAERLATIQTLKETHGFSDEWAEGHKKNLKISIKEILFSSFEEQEKHNPQIIVGADRTQEGLEVRTSDAILLKMGRRKAMEVDPIAKQPEYGMDGKIKYREMSREGFALKGRKLTRLFKEYYTSLGALDMDKYNDRQIGGMIYDPRRVPRELLSMSTSDFDAIFQDAMGKSLLQAYDEAPTQWPKFVEKITAPDLKTIHAIRLSAVGNLSVHDQGQELTYSDMTDAEETFSLDTRKLGLSLTEECFINDDMNAFARIPVAMGQAAKRSEDAAVAAVINLNANMSDTIALFQVATHKNYVASGAVINEATLSAADLAIRIQTGLKGETLNLMGSFLIVPPALRILANKWMVNTTIPTSGEGNPFSGMWQVITLPGLTSGSSTAWYLFCNPMAGSVSTIQIAFLQGAESPVYDMEIDFNTDGRNFKIKHYVAAKAVDWRGVYKNPGA